MEFTTTTNLTRWLTSYSFEQLRFNFVLYIALENEGQKRSNERFSVLSAKFTAILDCETSVCDIMAGYNLTRDKSSSRRFLQDFAIYNRAISEVLFKLLLTCVIHNIKE